MAKCFSDLTIQGDTVGRELLLRHRRARDAQRHWAARSATSSSVIRVFAKGTKPGLLQKLVELPVEEITNLRSRKAFEKWYVRQLYKLGRTLEKRNRDNSRVNPGMMWGHGAKVLSIYLRSLVLHSRFFSDRVVNRVKPWLFVPVDSYLIQRLTSCGIELPFTKIKEIASRHYFYVVQNVLADRCGRGIARIVFDDSWADRS
jgi:hypothetical protein